MAVRFALPEKKKIASATYLHRSCLQLALNFRPCMSTSWFSLVGSELDALANQTRAPPVLSGLHTDLDNDRSTGYRIGY